MKKILLASSILLSAYSFAQFNVKVEIPSYLSDSEIYLYGFNGSKEILYSKAKVSNNVASFKIDKQYVGMMRAFFKKANSSVNMVSENKDINFRIDLDSKNKISNVTFQDQANQLFSSEVESQKKQELILPALIQIKDYYKPSDQFYSSLETEISTLSNKDVSAYTDHPFLDFYNKNQKYSVQEKGVELKPEDFINFYSRSGEYLETSTILKPSLINFLNVSKSNVEGNVDKLLEAVNLETPRGQTIMSELIEIFNTYGMDKLKDKYLSQANNLKCTINDRLASTIQANKNTEIGAKMPNNNFVNAIHTKAKSLYDIKASKKIVVFWSSTCSHCEAELPKLLEKYDKLKAQNIEIIGFSLDSNLDEFKNKANIYPWVNDSEGKGWYSSYGDTYNIVATPTYFVLDADNKIISKPNHVGDVLDYLKVN
ncbi:TlpA disulfide reductase family protein [Epilithonimonas ginsengisoli]|uniref:TlpA disulfide reductase family protein n=1 Tax=Epilithonimonas ginsengisoli TaxID=1245592 RepID=A0ABU4JLT6_9FLAO|nr:MULTISPECIES: TlpA disulfide reductase family protein [Chryseobacterium group]MBV6881674.1 AhpC/TSA family protein [Epilithonimonas sp. FP105]MDW8550625.1 TlpA disulfide reductase family protein [Epilithonimonas ginsengisoli]OAH72059.1 thioredoxin [Chryseobacterium sp. FP211-J200]